MIAGEKEILIKDLYYVLMKNNLGNVKECRTLIKHHHVKVNGTIVDDIRYQVYQDDYILVNNQPILSHPFVYYMLNKPKGYISAKHDQHYPCINDLVDENCVCIGRLDKDTTGLLLLSNDSSLLKKLLLPQFHVHKKYHVSVKNKLDKNLVKKFEEGVIIDKYIKCKPARLEIIDDYHCYVTIFEGKYHQIKKMFLSCNHFVMELRRVSFANIQLDEMLEEGQYRSLTETEIEILNKQCKL